MCDDVTHSGLRHSTSLLRMPIPHARVRLPARLGAQGRATRDAQQQSQCVRRRRRRRRRRTVTRDAEQQSQCVCTVRAQRRPHTPYQPESPTPSRGGSDGTHTEQVCVSYTCPIALSREALKTCVADARVLQTMPCVMCHMSYVFCIFERALPTCGCECVCALWLRSVSTPPAERERARAREQASERESERESERARARERARASERETHACFI